MTDAAPLTERLGAAEREGTRDADGLALVRRLLERADALPPSGRARLLARAEALLEGYATRSPRSPREASGSDPWRELLEARARARAPRMPRDAKARAVVAEIRATKATVRAAERVPEAAGPYHGANVAARVLDELAALAPGYVSRYVASLEDLASLAALPERSAPARRKK